MISPVSGKNRSKVIQGNNLGGLSGNNVLLKYIFEYIQSK